MIYELSKENYHKAVDLFTNLKTNTAIESIFNYKNEARLFVDNLEKPRSILILNSWAYYYLAGDATNDSFNTSMVEFLENEFFKECIRLDKNIEFAFYPDNKEWCEKIEEIFSYMNLNKSGKTYFIYDEKKFNKNWRDDIPEGFKIERISKALIDSIENNKEFVDYIKFAWTSLDKYFDKGMGYCAVNESEFANICISVFASENEREVGIKTFDTFQRKGLAYLTACAYIEECLDKKFIPVWSCFSDNKKSIKLAEKLGYSIEDSHPIYFADISNKRSDFMLIKEYLNDKMYEDVNALQDICIENDKTTLKLELEYKRETANLTNTVTSNLNEFLYYHENILIGYIGICSFSIGEIEINGMVHPEFRRKGIFTKIFKEVIKECEKRKYHKLLLLSDRKSISGIAFIKSIKGKFDFAEHEMNLIEEKSHTFDLSRMDFRKATNADAELIEDQNRIYYQDVHGDEDKYERKRLLLPEEEEKKGMTIYLAKVNNEIIGKVNLYIKNGEGAIYGLGVLPEYRRKGYGRIILLKSLKIFKENNCSKVMLQVVADNEKALKLYTDCGFKVTSTMDYYKI